MIRSLLNRKLLLTLKNFLKNYRLKMMTESFNSNRMKIIKKNKRRKQNKLHKMMLRLN